MGIQQWRRRTALPVSAPFVESAQHENQQGQVVQLSQKSVVELAVLGKH